jgi:hypothetical protein
MSKPKKKGADPISFIRGFLGKPENKSPASKFVRAVNKRNEQLKKLGYK